MEERNVATALILGLFSPHIGGLHSIWKSNIKLNTVLAFLVGNFRWDQLISADT